MTELLNLLPPLPIMVLAATVAMIITYRRAMRGVIMIVPVLALVFWVAQHFFITTPLAAAVRANEIVDSIPVEKDAYVLWILFWVIWGTRAIMMFGMAHLTPATGTYYNGQWVEFDDPFMRLSESVNGFSTIAGNLILVAMYALALAETVHIV